MLVSKMPAREKNALMSIFDGTGPSIFCRKIEMTRPLREEKDGNGVFLARVGISTLIFLLQILLPICTLTWRVNNVSRQGKSINRRNESMKVHNK